MKNLKVYDKWSFNPYFNGYSTLTILMVWKKSIVAVCFNPYFNGYSTLTDFDFDKGDNTDFGFQSLF